MVNPFYAQIRTTKAVYEKAKIINTFNKHYRVQYMGRKRGRMILLTDDIKTDQIISMRRYQD